MGLIINIAVLLGIALLLRKAFQIMATLDETLAAVQKEGTVDDSIIALLTGIKAQLDAILAGALPPDVQTKVDAIFSAATANVDKVSAAVTANTPVASASGPEPPPPSDGGGSTEGPGH